MRTSYDYYPTAPIPPDEDLNFNTTPDTHYANPEMSSLPSVHTLLGIIAVAHMISLRFPGAANANTHSDASTFDNIPSSPDQSWDQSRRGDDKHTTIPSRGNSHDRMLNEIFAIIDGKATKSTKTNHDSSDPEAKSPLEFDKFYTSYKKHYGGMSNLLSDATSQFKDPAPTPRPQPETSEEAEARRARQHAEQERRRQAAVARLAVDNAVKADGGLNWMKDNYELTREIVSDVEQRRITATAAGETLPDSKIFTEYAATANKGMQGNTGMEDPQATLRFQIVKGLMGDNRKGKLPF